jgi:4-hydroxy-tetrahydrodipicolinate synthase
VLENPSTPLSTGARPSYAGIWVPIVTPFADDATRSVDYGALYTLVARYRTQGVAGFVACGSTGGGRGCAASVGRATRSAAAP